MQLALNSPLTELWLNNCRCVAAVCKPVCEPVRKPVCIVCAFTLSSPLTHHHTLSDTVLMGASAASTAAGAHVQINGPCFECVHCVATTLPLLLQASVQGEHCRPPPVAAAPRRLQVLEQPAAQVSTTYTAACQSVHQVRCAVCMVWCVCERR
jgi:hypothetical protein